MVIRAIVVNGMLKPLAPLPQHIAEGEEVELEVVADSEKVSPERREQIEAWYQRLQAFPDDVADQQLLQAALDEQRADAKAIADHA